MKIFYWALWATERWHALQLTKKFSTSIVSRLYLFPIVGSLFYDNVEQGKSKLPLLSFLLFACRVNWPCSICSISCRVNGPAHTLDACPVYSIGCRVNGPGPSSKRFRTHTYIHPSTYVCVRVNKEVLWEHMYGEKLVSDMPADVEKNKGLCRTFYCQLKIGGGSSISFLSLSLRLSPQPVATKCSPFLHKKGASDHNPPVHPERLFWPWFVLAFEYSERFATGDFFREPTRHYPSLNTWNSPWRAARPGSTKWIKRNVEAAVEFDLECRRRGGCDRAEEVVGLWRFLGNFLWTNALQELEIIMGHFLGSHTCSMSDSCW